MGSHQPHLKVVNKLLKQIYGNRILPDEKLPTLRQMATEMDVDHASIRIALKQLEAMKLVEIRRSDGVYVKDYMEHAGIDFLSAIFQIQESENAKPIVDEFLIDEVWEFWVLILPEVVRLASRKFSPRDMKSMIEILDDELVNIRDKKKLAGLELKSQELLAKVADNVVLTLMFNTARPIRKRMTEIFVNNVSEEFLLSYVTSKKTMLRAFMAGSIENVDHGIDQFKEMMNVQRQVLRKMLLESEKKKE